MKINIGEKLKKLRQEHFITQRKLAKYLGVMPQAVSSWELGINYPKLELIPVIAHFFGTTTDDLLDCFVVEQEHDIQQILDELTLLENRGDSTGKKELLEKAYQNYPFDDRIALAYAWHLNQELTDTPQGKSRKKPSQGYETISEICQRIIELCNVPHIRDQAIYLLALSEREQHGMTDARQILQMLPACYQDTLPKISEIFWAQDSESALRQKRENIMTLTDMLAHKLDKMCAAIPLSPEDKIAKLKHILSLYEMIYEKEDFGDSFYHISQLCQTLTELYLELNEREEAFSFLQRACDAAVAYDSLTDDLEHTSFFVEHISFCWADVESVNHRCAELYYDLTHKKCYSALRNDSRFEKNIEKLKKFQ